VISASLPELQSPKIDDLGGHHFANSVCDTTGRIGVRNQSRKPVHLPSGTAFISSGIRTQANDSKMKSVSLR
jgi:hypothetical protein